jgi:hypothetical protein
LDDWQRVHWVVTLHYWRLGLGGDCFLHFRFGVSVVAYMDRQEIPMDNLSMQSKFEELILGESSEQAPQMKIICNDLTLP